jgi:hypothetical protein
MQKRVWLLIWAGLFVFLEILSWLPVPDSTACLIDDPHGHQATNHNGPKYCPALHAGVEVLFERTDKFLEVHDKSVIGTFTIVLAISTIGLWLATNKLWSAGEEQLSHLRQTAERELRAYVMIENAHIDGLDVGHFPRAALTLKNTGTTPAYNLTHWCAMGFAPFPLEGAVPDSGEEIPLPPRPLAPGSIINTWATVGQNPPMNLATLNAMRAGTHALYIVGQIQYDDGFGNRRETEFLLFCGGNIGILEGGAVASYMTGNRIT